MTAEHDRLEEARTQDVAWKKWGPYLSERQWGTVREDYSEGGDAWNYFTHDQARSRAYRWGEDGIAGISDDKQRLCFALALWNGEDPILKERLFGLTNSESNHGEDVKEYYFYLDSTPTHSYMKYLYKYPQAAFPYGDLVETSRSRGRNQWSWQGASERPVLQQVKGAADQGIVKAADGKLGERFLYCSGDVPLLFTENETNMQRTFGVANRTPYVKDGINNSVVDGQSAAVNPAQTGTKAAAHYKVTIAAGKSTTIELRLSDISPAAFAGNGRVAGPFGSPFNKAFESRRQEADEFYKAITPPTLGADEANVMRQALAGMLWSKQFYHYDVDKWLEERGSDPFKATRKAAPRNDHWHHMYNGDVISMPDKWEYPWYAAWDLAFHVVALTL